MAPITQAVLAVIAVVLILGGAIGFLVWNNINLKKFNEKLENAKFKDDK